VCLIDSTLRMHWVGSCQPIAVNNLRLERGSSGPCSTVRPSQLAEWAYLGLNTVMSAIVKTILKIQLPHIRLTSQLDQNGRF
jgi:hypothetical protein